MEGYYTRNSINSINKLYGIKFKIQCDYDTYLLYYLIFSNLSYITLMLKNLLINVEQYFTICTKLDYIYFWFKIILNIPKIYPINIYFLT